MNQLGKVLVVVGLAVAAAGVLIGYGFGRDWLGRLPGDFYYSRHSKGGDFSFYFPLATCLLLSIMLAIVLWLFRK